MQKFFFCFFLSFCFCFFFVSTWKLFDYVCILNGIGRQLAITTFTPWIIVIEYAKKVNSEIDLRLHWRLYLILQIVKCLFPLSLVLKLRDWCFGHLLFLKREACFYKLLSKELTKCPNRKLNILSSINCHNLSILRIKHKPHKRKDRLAVPLLSSSWIKFRQLDSRCESW